MEVSKLSQIGDLSEPAHKKEADLKNGVRAEFEQAIQRECMQDARAARTPPRVRHQISSRRSPRTQSNNVSPKTSPFGGARSDSLPVIHVYGDGAERRVEPSPAKRHGHHAKRQCHHHHERRSRPTRSSSTTCTRPLQLPPAAIFASPRMMAHFWIIKPAVESIKEQTLAQTPKIHSTPGRLAVCMMA